MLSLLVPILVSCLSDAPKDRYARTLHDQALLRLNKIGPLYPAQFRTVMQSAPDLRACVERAVKSEASKTPSQQVAPVNSKAPQQQPAKPSIKLKTDFSNFTTG